MSSRNQQSVEDRTTPEGTSRSLPAKKDSRKQGTSQRFTSRNISTASKRFVSFVFVDYLRSFDVEYR